MRVDAKDFTDYAAVSFGPQPGTPEHVLTAAGDPKTRVAFKDYGYLRVHQDGSGHSARRMDRPESSGRHGDV